MGLYHRKVAQTRNAKAAPKKVAVALTELQLKELIDVLERDELYCLTRVHKGEKPFNLMKTRLLLDTFRGNEVAVGMDSVP